MYGINLSLTKILSSSPLAYMARPDISASKLSKWFLPLPIYNSSTFRGIKSLIWSHSEKWYPFL